MNTNLVHILEQLKVLTLLEARDLVKAIEKEFEVSIAQPLVVAPSTITMSNLDAAAEEEQSSFDFYLIEIPTDKKIAATKIIRSLTGFGLKESKDMVDAAPKLIKEGMSKDEAETLKNQLEAVGAKIQMK
uniref:Ribosomal protein L12 n=1 Tax=Spumella sp. Baekdong012001B8 TaxID=2782410 RepID=A0A7S6PVA2_9STRA|nr:ribosomal protein L12 [Spumella sp. Baekdong012001B8]